MLEPESIRTATTKAIDEAWAARLSLLRYDQLKIAFQNEFSIEKLELWLEMFGLSKNLIPSGLSVAEYQRLLQFIIRIFKSSGTVESLKLIGYVLGASAVRVDQDYLFNYDGESLYDGSTLYDGGDLVRQYIVRITINEILPDARTAFSAKYKELFDVSQPSWLYLKSIDFYGFPLVFSYTFK